MREVTSVFLEVILNLPNIRECAIRNPPRPRHPNPNRQGTKGTRQPSFKNLCFLIFYFYSIQGNVLVPHLGFFFGVHRRTKVLVHYFEIIIIMHKCIMTGVMVVVGNGTPIQPLVAMFLQLVFLLVVLKMEPYDDDLDDWSSFVCSFALTLTTLGGFLLMIPRQLTEDPVISVELLIDYFVDGHQWIVLCVRDARHWVRCISGQSDRRSVEEDTKEGEQQQQQPNESASDDKWRYMCTCIFMYKYVQR